MRQKPFGFVRPCGDDYPPEPWEIDSVHLPMLTVYEPDEPARSGLVDADGNPLVRERNSIGYLADL